MVLEYVALDYLACKLHNKDDVFCKSWEPRKDVEEQDVLTRVHSLAHDIITSDATHKSPSDVILFDFFVSFSLKNLHQLQIAPVSPPDLHFTTSSFAVLLSLSAKGDLNID